MHSRTVASGKVVVMSHPHVSSMDRPDRPQRVEPGHSQRPVVSRRRLLEGSAAVLGALALSAPSTAHRAVAADGTPEWNGSIDVFRLGTEAPHTTLMPYADLGQALAADRTRSPYRLSLDGVWKFAHADRPDDRDADFHLAFGWGARSLRAEVNARFRGAGQGWPDRRRGGRRRRPGCRGRPRRGWLHRVEGVGEVALRLAECGHSDG